MCSDKYERLVKLLASVLDLVIRGKRNIDQVIKVLQKIVEAPDSTPWWTVDDDGNIHFTLTSNGLTKKLWEQHFDRHRWDLQRSARDVLNRANEAPTNGVTYNIVVFTGREKAGLPDSVEPNYQVKPHWEVACLIHNAFTNEQLEQLGLAYILTMHEPIKNSEGYPCHLYSGHKDNADNSCYFSATPGRPGTNGGFAYLELEPEVQTESSHSSF